MKQYVSFQRLDIICSIQCLTEFYLKRFLPDLLLIQLAVGRVPQRRQVFRLRTHPRHRCTASRGQGRAKPSRPSGPAVQGFAEVPSAGTVLHRKLRVPAPQAKGQKVRAGVQNDHILIKVAHVLDDLVLALARLLENVPGRHAGTGRSEKNSV